MEKLEVGHTFICEKRKGTLFVMDPQTNDNNMLRYLYQGETFGYYRMDDLNINKNAAWNTVAKRSEKK